MSTAFGDRVAETGRTIDSLPVSILHSPPINPFAALFFRERKNDYLNMEWYNINPDTAKKNPSNSRCEGVKVINFHNKSNM
jgi:hypothetical protein